MNKYLLKENELGKCYVCLEDCNIKKCNCELKYIHQECINKLNNNNLKLNCPGCNFKYKMSFIDNVIKLYLNLIKILIKFLININIIYVDILKYNLDSGILWEEE